MARQNFFLKALPLLLPLLPLPLLPLHADDQLLTIFGSSGYILYKALDFANDHGFRYIKILSYEFNGFGLSLTGTCQGDRSQGRFFELKDDTATIALLCFKEKPADPYVIDLETYRFLLERVDLERE